MSGPDEFEAIARLFRPLTRGAPEALGLQDDAAAIPARPGYDLIVTKDAVVEGVHFPIGEAPDLAARKLLRVNLSDLAAKAAEPYGYFLAVSWPPSWDAAARESFVRGLDEDGRTFGLVLLGGDTTSTPGPMMASVTMLGWVPAGGMVRRGGARPGDLVLVSGPIGDGLLGLMAARGELAEPELEHRYRVPQPRLDLRDALRAHVSAAADISDGLIADAGHIAEASGAAITLRLEALPLSDGARRWLAGAGDKAEALLRLASGGDDYQIVCTAPPQAAAGLGLTVIGEVAEGTGVRVLLEGRTLDPGAGGWVHR
ncbi:MAG: thiamine-phosphate kinase [Phenylobacterium sp.]|jgi:thiamine-monophosphate kinase|uniref:thiamine-phosphate kinase n=1 Tax=Phenylobacterium sp. TaxID=1871053 RepID=UPI002A2A565D|nr:thiamine-phosphate kinase [Phenylobacterium sp.]MDD3836439.1 thiamine-phosphate kinase [Phenylobacterium sp.]MDX9999055.1 thiamine-phosphate kinase [Phenylobacterium sp.]